MSNLASSIADRIANLSLDAYYKLTKTGKPLEKEWTVLSCVLQNQKETDYSEVVSLGTGTKCIGATSKMSPKGDVLNDSHAEVIARRGFMVYLYDNMKRCLNGETTIFTFENNKFKLKDDVEFYFYSSQLPCGDACIMPKSVDEELFGDVLQSKKHKADNDICETEVKKPKLYNGDIHRTGAKCLPHCDQDLKDPGAYHLLGQVRTKPGRGDRTLSVSCSDKISRWIHVGIHGALLDMLVEEPIFIKLFVFGGGVPYSKESVERALLKRNCKNTEVKLDLKPELIQSTIIFPHIRSDSTVRAAPGSIVWIKLPNVCAEVAVQGRKLGVTKKKAALMRSSLCVSKYNLYKRFIDILLKNESLKNSIGLDAVENTPYNEMKSKSKRFVQNWEFIKKNFFGTWTVKPDIWNFFIDVK